MPLAVGEILKSEKWPSSISVEDMREARRKFNREYASLKAAKNSNAFGAALHRVMKTLESKINPKNPKEQWGLVCNELKRLINQGRSITATINKNRPRDLGIIEDLPPDN